ncbi:MAG: hypothetical protein ACMVY4_22060 [Minwuia sp.]|uniref:hypothetical protein n=1 Tax=Minwuia sp. TaxID=2493630 RepID=UPI003A892F28
MSQVTVQGILNILIGTELGGRMEHRYRVSLAVPNSLLGKTKGRNSSGFAFGAVQLDIGGNTYARAAYRAALDQALESGLIDREKYDDLIVYDGMKRPDLVHAVATRQRADRDFIQNTILADAAVRAIIDAKELDYLGDTLHPSVDSFIDAVVAKWGAGTVFEPDHADFHTAVAAMTSISNRTGGLRGSTNYFVGAATPPRTLDAVRTRYNKVLPPHDWHLIELGAGTYRDGGVI